MNMKRIIVYVSLFFSLVLFGCAKKEAPPITVSPTVSTPPQPSDKFEPSKKVSEEKKVSLEDLLKEQDKREEKKLDLDTIKLYGRGTPPLFAIFFDFDDYTIRSDMWDRLRSNAKFLLERKEVKIVLEGNCDERGTNEYNLALGMKRALEVKKALVRLGVEESRIEVESFGEERPICSEHDESCYALNRRVDFVIKQK
jgi:peptidoglycan-associated lipoprotein